MPGACCAGHAEKPSLGACIAPSLARRQSGATSLHIHLGRVSTLDRMPRQLRIEPDTSTCSSTLRGAASRVPNVVVLDVHHERSGVFEFVYERRRFGAPDCLAPGMARASPQGRVHGVSGAPNLRCSTDQSKSKTSKRKNSNGRCFSGVAYRPRALPSAASPGAIGAAGTSVRSRRRTRRPPAPAPATAWSR